MKKIVILCFLALSCLCYGQEPNCSVQEQVPLQLMSRELARGFKKLRKQKPPVYYLSYTYTQGEEKELSVSYGGVAVQTQRAVSLLEVFARAGSEKMDNTRALRGEAENWEVSFRRAPAPSLSSPKGFTSVLWRLTQEAAEQAQKEFSRVQANVRSMAVNQDTSNDFVFPEVSVFCREEPLQKIDLEQLRPLLTRLSQMSSGKDFVLSSDVSFSVEQGHRYFADSRGTRLKTPYRRMRLSYQFSGRGADGLEISRDGAYDVASVKDLPPAEELEADMRQSLEELEALSKAREGEAYNAPVLLKGRAAAVFVHEVMGHRLEGYRQKNAEDGQTLSGKVGQRVISELITLTADPTMKEFNGCPLRGYYEYDDEGVKARPVVLVENGVLKNFMMQSSPIRGFGVSNGHGRKQIGRRAAARMSVLRATASQTVPYETLEKMLVEEINRQGKLYGFIVEDLSGGYTFTSASMPQSFKLETKLVYKVYPDGRKEPVRGLDVVGTPLVSFNRILAAGDDDTVFNGSCGSVSGWVPQSNISPSLLFENMEVQKTQKSEYKPPVLPAPVMGEEKKK